MDAGGGTKWKSGAGGPCGLTADLDPERDQIATYGPEWSWVAELPRPFTLEGSTLRAFLDWVSREQGWRWQYQDQSMRARFDTIVQRGSIEGLTAKEALDIVLEANEPLVPADRGPPRHRPRPLTADLALRRLLGWRHPLRNADGEPDGWGAARKSSSINDERGRAPRAARW